VEEEEGQQGAGAEAREEGGGTSREASRGHDRWRGKEAREGQARGRRGPGPSRGTTGQEVGLRKGRRRSPGVFQPKGRRSRELQKTETGLGAAPRKDRKGPEVGQLNLSFHAVLAVDL